MIRFILITLFLVQTSWAQTSLEQKFKNKQYKEIADLYKSSKLNSKDAILVSYSLKALGRHRENIQLISTLIKKIHNKSHRQIYINIQNKETLDSEDYPQDLIILYWNIFNDYASLILTYKKNSSQLENDKKYFQTFRTILSELEFREGRVEKINDQIMSHLQYLNDIEYSFTKNWGINYVSWQHSSSMLRHSRGTKTNLVITNQGICVGGDIGLENGFYHYALEGCALAGSGGVTAYGDTNVTYQQTLSAFGFKMGPSVYKVVSSSRAKIGIALPVILTTQKLTQPDDPDYEVEPISTFSIVPTLIARWQFSSWFVKTEFGQYIGKNDTFWGIGFGRAF